MNPRDNYEIFRLWQKEVYNLKLRVRNGGAAAVWKRQWCGSGSGAEAAVVRERQWCGSGNGVCVFLAQEDYGRKFKEPFPACTGCFFCFFFWRKC